MTDTNRETITDLPIELFHDDKISSILGTTMIIQREVDKQVQRELDDGNKENHNNEGRQKRKAAQKSEENTKKLKQNRALKVRYCQTQSDL